MSIFGMLGIPCCSLHKAFDVLINPPCSVQQKNHTGMILPLNIYGDDFLFQQSVPMEDIDAGIDELVGSMFETLYKTSGLGLAAPQIGHSIQLFVVDISRSKRGNYANEKPLVVINPNIISVSGEDVIEETCLSIPGIRKNITRPAAITLQYHDVHFEERFFKEFNE